MVTPPKVSAPPKQLEPNDDDDELEKILKTGNIDAIISTDLSGKDKIVHAEDALDFESEDELAEEEDVVDGAEEGNSADDAEKDTSQGSNTVNGTENDIFDGDDWVEELGADTVAEPAGISEEAEDAVTVEQARQLLEQEEKAMKLKQLQIWYPGFQEHTILQMNKLFNPESSTYRLPEPQNLRSLNMARIRLDLAPDQASLFVTDQELNFTDFSKPTRVLIPEHIAKIEEEFGRQVLPRYNSQHNQKPTEEKAPLHIQQMETANWDDCLNDQEPGSDEESSPSPNSAALTTLAESETQSMINGIHLYDDEIYNSDDENKILESASPAKRTCLDLNDPYLTFVEDKRPYSFRYGGHGLGDLMLNMSNDRAYDMLRANYQRKVRSTIGSLNIDHAMPALRLQSPFYKIRHTKSQLRSWHRQKFSEKPGTVITFNSIKSRKKWKDKNRQTQDLFAKSSDLTMGDSGPLFVVEYSEETPLVLSGFGMGSKLINYYRKRNDNDTSRPKLPVGETHILEEQDKSTFWNFGFVEPGNTVPTLYNQMTRSPVFQHEPENTDFLLVRSTSNGKGTRYFIRQIPYLFVSGQLFPAVQIPGPHSRKVTSASKNRLKMVVYRMLNKDPNQRLQIRDISNIFPDHNEVQNRQRLKEFMEYQRSGDDQGFWKVKPGDHLPNEEEIRSLISPEDVMLLESMRAGQQRLDDSGYSKTVEDDVEENDGDNDTQSFEEQMAPWNLSRNFINAVQGKAMLALKGEGDPTGRREGFSFLRTSMKGGFASEVTNDDEKKLQGHSYNVSMQQRAYDDEISRIWYAQRRSLSINNPKKLPNAQMLPSEKQSATSHSPSGSSSDKVLQITRVIRDENDVLVRQTELVTNPQVIRAYMRRRKAAEEEKLAVDQISVTNDVEANKQRRKFLEQELARLNRNADRRQARKATKQDPKSKATTRKCATCGAIGHIKTNKSCPMYNDIYLNAASSSK